MSTLADALRDLAEWLDEHPDLAACVSTPVTFDAFVDKGATAEIARKLVGFKKVACGDWLVLRRMFGAPDELGLGRNNVQLDFNWARSEVCTARVLGKKLVPEKPAVPAHEEDVIEWECHPLLAQPATDPTP